MTTVAVNQRAYLKDNRIVYEQSREQNRNRKPKMTPIFLIIFLLFFNSISTAEDILRSNLNGSEILLLKKQAEEGDFEAQRKLDFYFKQQFAVLEQKAKTGDANAQLEIGDYYSYANRDNELSKYFANHLDYIKAAEWYLKSANQENTEAQLRLCGLISKNRIETIFEKNGDAAVRWCQKLAEDGNSEAQKNLALLHITGKGVPYDRAKAFALFVRSDAAVPVMLDIRKKAEIGNATAQYALGAYYYCLPALIGTDEMLMWWQKSAEQGNWRAQLALSRIFYAGERIMVKDNYQFAGIHHNPKEAFFWSSAALKVMAVLERKNNKIARSQRNEVTRLQVAEKKRLTHEQILTIEKRVNTWNPPEQSIVNANVDDAPAKIPQNGGCQEY